MKIKYGFLWLVIMIGANQLTSCSTGEIGSISDIQLVYTIDEADKIFALTQDLEEYHILKGTPTRKVKAHAIDFILGDSISRLKDNAILRSVLNTLIDAQQKDPDAMREAILSGRFQKLLPENLLAPYDARMRQLNESSHGITLGMEANVLFMLSVLQPYLGDLLDLDELTMEDLVNAYQGAREADNLRGIVLPFLKSEHNALAQKIFEPEFLSVAAAKIQELEKIGTFTFPVTCKSHQDSIDYIQKFYAERKKYYALRKEVMDDCRKAVDKLSKFKETYSRNRDTAYNVFADMVTKKRFELASILSSGQDYVDLLPVNGSSFRIRFRLKEGALSRLKQDRTILNTRAEVFLCYTIHQGNNSPFVPLSNPLSIRGEVNQLETEIPIGLTLEGINLSMRHNQADHVAEFVSGLPDIGIKMDLPDIGVWSRYIYDNAILEKANELLGCSEVLGIKLRKLTFNPDTWQPSFLFTWQPQGMLTQFAEPEMTQVSITAEEWNELGTRDFKVALKRILVRKVCSRIEETLKRSALLKTIWRADEMEVHVRPISEGNDLLVGELKIRSLTVPVLEKQLENVKLTLNFCIVSGRPRFTISQVGLGQFIPMLREKIESETEKLFESFTEELSSERRQYLGRKVQEFFAISNLYLTTDVDGIAISINGQNFQVRSWSDFEVCLSKLITDVRNKIWHEVTKGDIPVYVAKQIGGAIIPCETIEGKSIDFFGLTFNVERADCQAGKASFTATFQEVVVKGTYENGKFSVTDFDAQRLLEKVKEHVPLASIKLPDFVYLTDYRLTKDGIQCNLWMKMEALDLEERIGELTIRSDGRINFNTTSLRKFISDKLTQFIHAHEDALPLGDFAGLSVTFRDIDLVNYLINFNAVAEFDQNIKVRCTLSLNFKTGTVTSNVIDDPMQVIRNTLATGILNGLLGTEDAIVLDNVTGENIRLMQITGSVNLTVLDFITLPSIRFTLTKTALELELRPKFTLPVVVPLAPPVVSLVNPSVELKIDNKSVEFAGCFAPGVLEDARVFMNLIKVNAKMNIDYGNNPGDIVFTGDLMLVHFIPLAQGEGKILLSKGSAYMEQGTSGILDKILHLKTRSEFGHEQGNGTNKFFVNSKGELKILGIAEADLTVSLTLQLKNDAGLFIDGRGQVKLPIGYLRGNVGTKLTENITTLMNEGVYASVAGGLNIGSFELAGVKAKADLRSALLQFSVGPLKLGARLPTLSSFTSDYIIEMILAVFGSLDQLPDALLHFLENPNITLGVPFGRGGDEMGHVGKSAGEGNKRISDAGGKDDGGQGDGGSNNENGGSDGKEKGDQAIVDKPVTEITGKLMTDVPFQCNCGDSDYGLTIIKFKDLNPDNTFSFVQESGFSFGVPMRQYLTELGSCSSNLFDNVYTLAFTNRSGRNINSSWWIPKINTLANGQRDFSRGTNELKNGQAMVLGYFKVAPEYERVFRGGFNFIPFVSMDQFQQMIVTDPYSYAFRPSPPQQQGGKTMFKLQNSDAYTFESSDGTLPVYNFILAYSESEVFVFATTVSTWLNSFSTPSCVGRFATAHQLYQSGEIFHEESRDLKIIYEFSLTTGLFKKKWKENTGKNYDFDEMKFTHPFDEKEWKKTLREAPESKLYLLQTANGQIEARQWMSDTRIFFPEHGSTELVRQFTNYMDGTLVLSGALKREDVLSMLNGCESSDVRGFKGKVNAFRKNGISSDAMARLIKFFNQTVNKLPLDYDQLCTKAIVKEVYGSVFTYPTVQNNGWRLNFTIVAWGNHRRLDIEKCDLLQALEIDNTKRFNQQLFDSNPMFRKLLAFMNYNGDVQRLSLNLISANRDQVQWLKNVDEERNAYSLITMKRDSAMLIERKPQIFLKLSDDEQIDNADFFTKSSILKDIPYLDRVYGDLSADSAQKVVVTRLDPSKGNSPLVVYHETPTTVYLWYQQKLFNVPRQVFNRNLNLALQATPGTGQVRINRKEIMTDLVARATFIFDGLRGYQKWYTPSGSEINPYALFNEQLGPTVKAK